MSHAALNLVQTFVRTRGDGRAELLPVDDTFWQRLSSGALGDFHREQLISAYDMDADWTSWEMHPKGDELVCLLSGAARFIIESTDGTREISLTDAGAFLLVPAGCWHTAKISTPSRLLFVTPGEGTMHRPA